MEEIITKMSSMTQLSTSELRENTEVDQASSSAPKTEDQKNLSLSLPELRDLHRKGLYPKISTKYDFKPRASIPTPVIDFSKYPIKQLNKPRNNKRLLVFEIDHVLCHLAGYPRVDDPAIIRPYYNGMFKDLYKTFDIILWSVKGPVQTRVMLRHLKVLEDEDFKILCCMDSSHLFLYDVPNIGFKSVKPLQIIWHYFTMYNETNTIIIDYNEYNMYFNRSNGMKIAKYFRHHVTFDVDLRHVKAYLLWVAKNCMRNVTKYRFYDYKAWY